MNTLDVYDSRFGNTKLVAQAIGEAPEAADQLNKLIRMRTTVLASRIVPAPKWVYDKQQVFRSSKKQNFLGGQHEIRIPSRTNFAAHSHLPRPDSGAQRM